VFYLFGNTVKPRGMSWPFNWHLQAPQYKQKHYMMKWQNKNKM